MADRIEPAECRGYSAFYPSGTPRLLCPYPIGSRDRERWIDGWYQASLDWITNSEKKQAAAASPAVDTAMRKLRMAGPGTELAYAVKELIEAMLEARS